MGVVMGGNTALVGIDLPEQERLDEAPSRHDRMAVVKRLPQGEGLQHVALDIDIGGEIGLGDIGLIEGADRAERAIVAKANPESVLALADLARLPAGELDREGRGKPSHAIEQEI